MEIKQLINGKSALKIQNKKLEQFLNQSADFTLLLGVLIDAS